MKRALAVLAVSLLVACGDGPTDPPTSDLLTGTWTASRVGDWQNVTLNLVEHSPSDISGTWTGNLGGGTRSGLIVSGSRSGQNFTLTLDTGGMPCGYGTYVEATRSNGAATGTARAVFCDGGRSAWNSPVMLSR